MLKRVAKNSFFILLTQTFLLGSNLILYVLVGRFLGAGGLGQLSFIMAYTGLFTVFADFGLSIYLTREIARHKEKLAELLGLSVTLITLTAPITFSLIVAIGYLLKVEPVIQASLFIAGIYLIFGGYISLLKGVFFAYEMMELETITIAIERTLTFILCLISLFMEWGILALVVSHLIARAVNLIVTIIIYKQKSSSLPHFSFSLRPILGLLYGALPFSINILTTTIYIQVDVVLLTLLISDEASGFYKAATNLVIPLAVIASALNSSLLPGMARAFTSSIDIVKKLTVISLRYLFMIGYPIALGIITLAPQIISLLYEVEFTPSVIPLQILAIIIPMRFINNTMATSLTAIDQQKARALIILIGAIINLVLNLIFIPYWSFIGASITTTLTEIFITIALVYSLRRYIGPFPALPGFWRVAISGLIMVLVTISLREYNLFLNGFVSVLVYGALIFILRAVPIEDLLHLINSIRRKQISNSR